MAVATIEDLSGSIEMVLFPEALERCGDTLVEDAVIVVRGKVDVRNDTLQIVCEDVEPYVAPERPEPVERQFVTVEIPVTRSVDDDQEAMRRIARLLREFPGDDRLFIRIPGRDGTKLLRSSIRIDWCVDLERAIAEVVGSNKIAVVSTLVEPTAA